ncbi:anti-sigma regulatory factor [Streptomyces sp. PT12]|uniref:ATP-binding protein n=1 Tax=Streptomyces sp. PT12 TaxID=1510197 RepID=UPI00215C33E1|nr:ATP-binding protein [Streptomyces sp. PT12]
MARNDSVIPDDALRNDALRNDTLRNDTLRNGTERHLQEAEQIQAEHIQAEHIQQVRRLRLVGGNGVVSRAREFTRAALHDWGWLPAATEEARALAEDVLLVVSELVTNACLHADGPDELRLGRGVKLLRVEVADRGAGIPALRTTRRVGRPGGHGMFIVQRLCLDWGVVTEPATGGKTVWAELAAPTGD